MSATIRFNDKTATISNGVWTSNDQPLADRLQYFRDETIEGMKYRLDPDHFDSLDARAAVEFLGGDAEIVRADDDLPKDDEPEGVIH